MTDAEFINGFQTGCGQHKDAIIMINKKNRLYFDETDRTGGTSNGPQTYIYRVSHHQAAGRITLQINQ